MVVRGTTLEEQTMKKNAGFTLVELMIVVAIIAIIAAIAIPGLARARTNANESAARADLKALVGAQVAYSAAHGSYTSTANLIDATAGPRCLASLELAAAIAGGTDRGGYTFAEGATMSANELSYSATPTSPGKSGTKTFTITESDDITSVDALS